MDVKVKDKKRNPYQVLYLNPHMGAQKFAKMVTKYHQERELDVLRRISVLAGRDLVQSKELNWRQRIKYSEWAFRVGKNTIYLLPKHTCIKTALLDVWQEEA